MLSRKKRRGIIEKRRRDRINTSLSELRRLVPTAYEKQGSAKLEKAEILQMTVDHLKMLHSKGLDALAYDPSKFAMDYHNIGFRECAAEVARYLVSVEGLDIQDPLRLRMMSHLQCFAAQREFATKQTAWYPGTNCPNSIAAMPPTATSNVINASHNYQSGSPLSPIGNSHSHQHHPQHHPHHQHHVPATVIPAALPPPSTSSMPIVTGTLGLQHHNSSLNSSSGSSILNTSITGTSSHSLNSSFETNTTYESTPTSSSSNGQHQPPSSNSSTLTPLTTVSSISTPEGYHPNHQQHHQQHQHPSIELSPYHHHLSGGIHHQQQHNMHQQQSHHHPYSQTGNDPSAVSSQMKPYRPWGAELAY